MTGNVFTCLLLAIDVKSCLAISQSCDQRTFPRSYYSSTCICFYM